MAELLRGLNESCAGTSLEQTFAAFYICAGIFAFVANASILVVVLGFVKRDNALFMIITSISMIDMIKSICAVYMGFVILSIYTEKRDLFYICSLGQEKLFTMLQVSIFMLHFGNLCSVFNLILATLNEFLFIKFLFHYRNWVTKGKAIIAIILTWVTALIFTFARALHRAKASKIWIYEIRNDTELPVETSSMGTNSPAGTPWNDKLIKRSGDNTDNFTEAYSLGLIAFLLLCLLLIFLVYFKLYRIVKRSSEIDYNVPSPSNRDSSSDKSYQMRKSSNHQTRFSQSLHQTMDGRRHRSTRSAHSKMLSATAESPNVSICSRESHEHTFRPYRSRKNNRSSKRRNMEKPRPTRQMRSEHRNVEPFGRPIGRNDVKTANTESLLLENLPSPEDGRKLSKSRYSQPLIRGLTFVRSRGTSVTRVMRFQSVQIMQRYKYVIVIMTVCAVYTTYLLIYFALQILNHLHVTNNINRHQLRQLFIIQFVLRALYVGHAVICPLLFLRIRSFKSGLNNLYTSMKRWLRCSSAEVAVDAEVVRSSSQRAVYQPSFEERTSPFLQKSTEV